MADLARIKNNVRKMVEQNAPETDIDAYIESEGVTLDEVRTFKGENTAQQSGYQGGAFRAATEGSQAGLMFGFDDEIGAGMMAPIHAGMDWMKGEGFSIPKAYTRLQQEADARKAARRAEHPVASIAGEVAGGLATGAGASRAGLTLAARPASTMLGRIGLGAAEGAGYGALYGAGEAKPGERMEGAAMGGAFGGVVGGGLGAVGGAMANRAARKAANAAAPSSDDLARASQSFYRAAEAEGVRYKAPSVQRLGQNLKLAAGRVNDRLRPKTAGFVDDIDDMLRGDMSLEVFDELRKSLAKELKRASPDDARTLSAMKRVADAWADNIEPGQFTGDAAKAMQYLKQARQMWAQHSKADVVERIMDQADVDGTGRYTQSGFANAIRSEMNKLYKSIKKGKAAGWSKEEVDLIRQMAKGGSSSQMVNWLAKLNPRGVVSIAMGQLIGSAVPGIGNVAVPLAGHAAGRAADAGALQAAQTLRNAAAMGTSPAAARIPQLPNRLAPLIPGAIEASMGVPRILEGSR